MNQAKRRERRDRQHEDERTGDVPRAWALVEKARDAVLSQGSVVDVEFSFWG